MRVLVIGACNIDVIGTSKNPIKKSESNIGDINIAVGGVAKNIATNLQYLKADVCFLTAIGNDDFASMQINHLQNLGLDFSESFRKDAKSSIYLAIHDDLGELETAVNDMNTFQNLTIEDFETKHEYIEQFDALVFDTNLNEETLTYLIKKYKNKKIFVDGVSQSKVGRIKNVMEYIDLLKINQFELYALLNLPLCDIIVGVREITKLGVKNCVVSSQKEPITYNIDNSVYQSITHKTKDIKSTIGAGDALFSGIILYLLNNKNMHEAVNFGKIVASKTLEVYEANNKEIVELIDL
jgi:pseudouridine kinase